MTRPDSSLLKDVVAPKVLAAMELASEALVRAGIRHVVVGGLAVGANGYPRATADVDFLVGGEAFEHHAGGLITFRAGVPVRANGVTVSIRRAGSEEGFLHATLAAPPGSVIGAAPLVYLKLKSGRQKDRADILELIKAGIDVNACRAYLTAHAPEYLEVFEEGLPAPSRKSERNSAG